MEERAAIRRKAAEARVWPLAGGADYYLIQATRILLPSAFSPAQ